MQDADHDGAAPDAAKTEATQVDSNQAEPKNAAPSRADADRDMPQSLDPAPETPSAPSRPELSEVEPDRAEEASGEAEQAETSPAEPGAGDKNQTEPVEGEPSPTDAQAETQVEQPEPEIERQSAPEAEQPTEPEVEHQPAPQAEQPAAPEIERQAAPEAEQPAEPKAEQPAAPEVEAAASAPTPVEPKQGEPAQDAEAEPEFPLASLDTLPPRLRTAVAAMGWEKLMPVQERAIPNMLAGRDVMVQSRTGSGKTGAFLLPILDKIDPDLPACQALVLAPTRELAAQVARDAETMGSAIGVRSVAVYGGVGYGPQIEAFRQGAHIVVGAPGRILDHLLRGNLSLKDVRFLVFDEADRMLSIGFYPDMKAIQRYLPRELQGCMFSATFPQYVLRLADEFLRQPEFLSMAGPQHHVAETVHIYSVVQPMEKDRCLIRYIELENPSSAIIFCNTRSNVHYVTAVLQGFGYDADEISSDLAQGKREATLERVRKGELRFLVATDVAARGIDIQELSHVFLYDQPEDPESYVHRAGRTGRAGASGIVISMVDVIEELKLRKIGKQFRIPLEKRDPPSDEEVQSVVAVRVTALLEARLRALKSLQSERLRRFVPLVRSLGQSDEESALLAMLLDEYYQQTLHAAPPQPAAPAPVREDRERRESREAFGGREEREGARRKRKRRDRRRSDEGVREAGEARDETRRSTSSAMELTEAVVAAPQAFKKPETIVSSEPVEPEDEAFESGPAEAAGLSGAVGEERKKRRRRRRRRSSGAQAAARGEERSVERAEERPSEEEPTERTESDITAGERGEGMPEEGVEALQGVSPEVGASVETGEGAEPSPEAPAAAEATPPAADEGAEAAKPQGRTAGRSRSRTRGKAKNGVKDAAGQKVQTEKVQPAQPTQPEDRAPAAPKEGARGRGKPAGRPEAKAEAREKSEAEDAPVVEVKPAPAAKPKRSIFGLNEPYTGDDEEDEDIDI